MITGPSALGLIYAWGIGEGPHGQNDVTSAETPPPEGACLSPLPAHPKCPNYAETPTQKYRQHNESLG